MTIRQMRWSIRKSMMLFMVGFLVAIPLKSVAQTAEPAMDSKANMLFQEMAEHLKSSQSFSFDAEITYDEVHLTDQKLQFGAIASYAVRRPNLVQANYQGDRRQVSFFYDGINFSMLEVNKNLYGIFKAAANIDGLVDQIQDDYGFSLPMGDLLSTQIYPMVMQNALSSRYVGRSDIRGVSCHHLAFTGESRDLQIWISERRPPVPCKFIVTYKDEPTAPQYTAIFANWDFQERSANDPRFRFSIPPNAQRIDVLPGSRRLNSGAMNRPTGETP